MQGRIKYFLLLLLIATKAGNTHATTDSTSRLLIFKYYPINSLFGQAGVLCSDQQFALEYRFAPKHSIQAAVAGIVPNPFYAIAIKTGATNGENEYYFFGGRAQLGYRHYLWGHETSKRSRLYMGAEISVAGLSSLKKQDSYSSSAKGPGASYSWSTKPYVAKAVMSNYNFTIGWHILKPKLSIDVGFSVGFRYHYFWRTYRAGNLEFATKTNGSLYWYYKTSPVGGAFNLSIGGPFTLKKRP